MTEYWPFLAAGICVLAVVRCAARQRHGVRSLLAGAVCGLGALAVLGLPLAVFLVIASQPGINQVLYAGGHHPLQVLHSHLAANTELLAALGIGGIYLLLPESRKA